MRELHPDGRAAIGAQLQKALLRLGRGSPVRAGLALGDAIGAAAVRRRAADGYHAVRPFASAKTPGRWRPAPPMFDGSNTTETRPFLLTSAALIGARPPPVLGSLAYTQGVETTRRLGAAESTERTADQTEAAIFWATQSSQRGFLHLAVTLLDQRPRPGGVFEHARIMSLLAAALADSAIVAWQEKEGFSLWRPITAIREGGFGLAADPEWRPLIETPPHPEYPSGHAADCYTGASLLAAALGWAPGPIRYVALRGAPQAEATAIGMGQHVQPIPAAVAPERDFPNLAAAAEDCAHSRIWAGAHFPAADEEARRIAGAITRRAMASVPPLR